MEVKRLWNFLETTFLKGVGSIFMVILHLFARKEVNDYMKR
ncbi:hypothetical protein [Virgibacillus necropolis]